MGAPKVLSEEFQRHKPVLVQEVLTYLDPQPGNTYIDVTFGSGGHTRAILEHESACKVIALDWDTASLDTFGPPLEEEFEDRLQLVWSNFAHLYRVLKKIKISKVDGILADFGTSQMQIKQRPGFSVYLDTPLDMRMSPAYQQVTAAQLVNKATEEKLREIFWQLGEERHAKKIAWTIVQVRKKKKIRTTGDLVKIIEQVIPKKLRRKIHPATKVFQALRMYINRELENIHSFLSAAVRALNTGGRLVCISFHSLEDRMVKQFFRDEERKGRLDILTKKVVTACSEEIAENPSARSARLRAAQCKEEKSLIIK